MTLGKVAGTVTVSVRGDSMDGPRFLLVEFCDERGAGTGSYVTAADLVSSRTGDMVMVSQGSSCRWTFETEGQPVDAVIVGIIDRIDQGERNLYRQQG